MADYITLLGAEEVSRAARNMQAAAEEISRAAQSIAYSSENLRASLDSAYLNLDATLKETLARLEKLVAYGVTI